MTMRPPVSTRTDARFPYTPLFRSESMSNVEHYSTALRKGARMGSLELHDRPIRARRMSQPVERYGVISGMIETAENLARDYGITRERSEEHTSELKSLMSISYAVLGLKKKKI